MNWYVTNIIENQEENDPISSQVTSASSICFSIPMPLHVLC